MRTRRPPEYEDKPYFLKQRWTHSVLGSAWASAVLRSGSAAGLCSNTSRDMQHTQRWGSMRHRALRWMLRLQNATLSPPAASRKSSVQSAFKSFHHDRHHRGLRKEPVVTLTCASWGSVENIISGYKERKLSFLQWYFWHGYNPRSSGELLAGMLWASWYWREQ